MRWLFENWQQLVPAPWFHLILAPIATFCGGLIGFERVTCEKPAGIRTMSLVCLGACIFTIAGSFFTASGDSGRVAAQIVTGIGFLGGGMLIRGPGGVTGVTTAATVWVVAALGVVIGTGHIPGALALTVLIFGVLRTVGAWERTHLGGGREVLFGVVFDPIRGKTSVKLTHVLDDFKIPEDAVAFSDAPEGRVRWTIRCRLTARRRHNLLLQLAEMPEIYAIEGESREIRASE
jgi:putative Mg2+ transporter-C (MgtC) family protein